MRSAVRATDIVCRLAGDEVTIILEGGTTVTEMVTVANKVLAAMAPPFLIDGKSQRVTTSMGVAFRVVDKLDLAELADDALYQAKAAGRNGFACDR